MIFRERARPLATAAVAGAAVLVLAGCGAQQDSSADAGKLTVVTSTNVWGNVVQEVGGNAVDVQPLISDPSADPHSYESTPQDAAKVAEADLVVFNGGGYDEFAEKILQAGPQGKPSVEAFAVAEKPEPPVAPQEPEPAGEDAHGHSADHSVNEHFWYDVHSVEAVAHQVAVELGKLQPERAQEFSANAERLGSEVGSVGEKVERIAAARPGAKVITTEPVAYYLIKESGLDDITPDSFMQAVEEESDPPAAAIAEVLGALDSRQAAALIFNSQTESPVTGQLRTRAEQLGIPVVEMTETLPEDKTYVQWMDSQVSQLSKALNVQ